MKAETLAILGVCSILIARNTPSRLGATPLFLEEIASIHDCMKKLKMSV
jgi:hypothetical protein